MSKTATLLLLCTALFAQQKGTLTDTRDGKIYKTVKIGNQVWMAENLNYEASGSKCYDNKPANCKKYGRLYNWNTAKTACPSGWHLPSDDELDTLLRYVDCITCPSCFYIPDSSAYIISLCYGFCISETNSIYKSKNVYPISWYFPKLYFPNWYTLHRCSNDTIDKHKYYKGYVGGKLLKATSGWGDGNGEDKFGFSALPGGKSYYGPSTFANMFIYYEKGSFRLEGDSGYWWSASESRRGGGIYKYIYNYSEGVDDRSYDKKSLLSVRCVQNTTAPPKGSAK